MAAPTANGSVIGIDLGTTNSCVGVWKNGRVEIVANTEGFRTTPSVVSFTDTGILIGQPAVRKMLSNPNNTIYDMKRLLGKKLSDPTVQKYLGYWPFKVIGTGNGGDVPLIELTSQMRTITQRPIDISAKVLTKMKETAESSLRFPCSKAVITVPAYFTQSQKAQTIEAAKLAQLEVLELITEPAAAAYAYGLDSGRTDDYKVLVFDYGGGTFDVSVMEVTKGGHFRVLAIGGDTSLGGRDFDYALLDHCQNVLLHKHHKDISLDPRKRQMLLSMCESMKIALSSSEVDSLYLGSLFADLDSELVIDRDQFDECSSDLIHKAMAITKGVLAEANLLPSQVQEVLMVGGSSRIPLIHSLLGELFPNRKLNSSVNADEAIAYGATIRAAQLCDQLKQGNGVVPKLELVEATPLSLGIGIEGGRFSVMIPRNSAVPVQKTGSFVTCVNDQKAVKFSVS